MAHQPQFYIDGRWVKGSESFVPLDPTTGRATEAIYEAFDVVVDAAVSAARRALPAWRALPVSERCAVVQKAADILVESYGQPGERTALKNLIVTEMGKRLPEADIEVIESSDMLAFFAANGQRLLASKALELDTNLWATKESTIVFEPVGVVGVIKPWNYPLEIPIWTLGPALVAGNTVVFKPSEHSSLVGLEIARIFERAGLPPGVLNVVTGRASAGRSLVKHSDVDMIAFTGSVETGREIAVECARRLRRFTLELGGNDPAIVDRDVDLDLAANGIVWGAFCNSGQVCVRTKRVYVHEEIAADLISMISRRASELRKDIDYGPIVSQGQLEKIESFLADAVSKGARVLVGGNRLADVGGFYFPPTVLVDVPTDALLLRDECFGPVLPVMAVPDMETAITLSNSGPYGLGASVWTANLDHGRKLADGLECGMVWINDVNVALPQAPWGGIKQSGFGVDLSEFAIYEYVIKKHICVEKSNKQRRDWWYPYVSSEGPNGNG